MDAYYQGTYRDEQGEEAIVVHNDGTTLRMTIRGVEFATDDFEELLPLDKGLAAQQRIALSDIRRFGTYKLSFTVPVIVVSDGNDVEGQLEMVIIPISELRQHPYQLSLYVNEAEFRALPNSPYIDDLLLDIQNKLPSSTFMKICATCAFSVQEPYMPNAFGSIACFRNHKEKIVRIKNQSKYDPKAAFVDIWQNKAQWVQEIYLCSEFERFIPNMDKNV